MVPLIQTTVYSVRPWLRNSTYFCQIWTQNSSTDSSVTLFLFTLGCWTILRGAHKLLRELTLTCLEGHLGNDVGSFSHCLLLRTAHCSCDRCAHTYTHTYCKCTLYLHATHILTYIPNKCPPPCKCPPSTFMIPWFLCICYRVSAHLRVSAPPTRFWMILWSVCICVIRTNGFSV